MRKALEKDGDNAVVLDHLGDILAKRGRVAEALQYWQKALKGEDEEGELDRPRVEAKIRDAQGVLQAQQRATGAAGSLSWRPRSCWPRPPAPERCRLRPRSPGAPRHCTSYSASLRVSVSGAELRGRSRALVAFRRPDALRIEIPGPSGARLVAVAREGRLTAVLPAERAVLEREASPAELEALIGIALAPEAADGHAGRRRAAGARELRGRWGRTLPTRIDAVLDDGTRVRATVDEADAGETVAGAAFDPPSHAGYRPIDADEARRLLGGR